jgi:hypothetical protein
MEVILNRSRPYRPFRQILALGLGFDGARCVRIYDHALRLIVRSSTK